MRENTIEGRFRRSICELLQAAYGKTMSVANEVGQLHQQDAANNGYLRLRADE